MTCPLTIIENIFNQNQYSQSFIKFWISKIVYWDFPTLFFITLYSLCALWTVLMWKIFPPRKINKFYIIKKLVALKKQKYLKEIIWRKNENNN